MDKYLPRRYPRLKTNIPTQFISNNQLSYGKIEDISGGGLRIRTLSKLDFDSHIIPYFILNNEVSLMLKGRLIWKKKIPERDEIYVNGIEFINVFPESRSQIINYVNEKIK